MASKMFNCRLITPTDCILDEPVTYASVPAWDGLFGILPGRAPIVAKLGLGELHLKFPDRDDAKGGTRSYLVEDGFVQMIGDKLTILAAQATPAESITLTDAKAELKEAEARHVPEGADDATAQLKKISAQLARSRAKVRIAQKFREQGGAI